MSRPATYDLLIGADGLNSTVRDLIGIDTKPQPTGMGIWRTFVSRPAEVERSELYYGGPVYIAGYTPTGEDTMYAFLVEKAQDRFGHLRRRGRDTHHARGVSRLRRAVELDPRRPRGGRARRTTPGSHSTSSRARGTAAVS